MAPEDAIANLMPLTLEQNITLFIGMQPKSIALILQQFLASGDRAQVERRQQIFQAINRRVDVFLIDSYIVRPQNGNSSRGTK